MDKPRQAVRGAWLSPRDVANGLPSPDYSQTGEGFWPMCKPLAIP